MKSLRKIIFWLHLLTGTCCGLIIFTMCVTGALIAFEPQVLRFAEREFRQVKPGPHHQPTDLLLENALKHKPQATFSGLTLQADPNASAMITIRPEGVLYINPYTTEILGEGSKPWREFFHVVTDVHRWLAAEGENRVVARSITGFCNAAFLVLAISGIYMWWPTKWKKQYLRPITWFQRGLTSRARDFNWHNVIGFWCAPIVIVLTITALVLSYEWANNLLYTLTASEKPPSRAASARDAKMGVPKNLELLRSSAIRQVPNWRSMNIRFQTLKNSGVQISIDDGSSLNPLARSQLTLNSLNGQIIKWEPYVKLNAGRKLRIWFRALHTGEGIRLPGQVIAFVATIGGGFLVCTGAMLAIRRFSAWIVRNRREKSVKEMPKKYEEVIL